MKNPVKKKEVQIQTDYGQHVCVFEVDKEGFLVTAKNLPGIVTWGKNFSHAKKMAKEAIELCIESLVDRSIESKKVYVRERIAHRS